MGLWSRLLRWRAGPPSDGNTAESPETEAAPRPESTSATVDLPAEPFVFECQTCGKVFEARRKHPRCAECDSRDVSLLAN